MPDTTPNLALPFILPAQAQKHVTHNEALQRLDALVQLTITDQLAEPPIGAQEGEAFVILSEASGAWSDRAGRLAVWRDDAWLYLVPKPGWRAYVQTEERMKVFDGQEWKHLPLPASIEAETLGLGATPTNNTRLAIASHGSLFTHQGAGHSLKINKAAATETASLMLQTNWSGRAEIGLTGDDHLSIRVSADGNTWVQALEIRPDGMMRGPARPIARAALAPQLATLANGTVTGFDQLHLGQGGVALGAPLPSGYGKPLVVPVAGVYQMALTVTPDGTGFATVTLKRNGTVDLLRHAGQYGTSTSMALVYLELGDELTLQHSGPTGYYLGYAGTELNLMMV